MRGDEIVGLAVKKCQVVVRLEHFQFVIPEEKVFNI